MSGFVCALEEVSGSKRSNATLSHESWASGTVEMKKCERLSWTESKQRRWMIITQFTMQKLNSPNDCY